MDQTMRIKIGVPSSIVSVAAFLLLVGISMGAGQATLGCPDSASGGDFYRQVLNLVFAVSPTESAEYELILRFAPPDEPESQIQIAVQKEKVIRVTFSTLHAGSEPVLGQIAKMANDENLTPKKVAEGIRREVRVLQPSAKLHALLQNYRRLRLSPVLNTQAILDGTVYEFRFEAPSNQFSYIMNGSVTGTERHDNRLVKWMASVKSIVSQDARNAPSPWKQSGAR